MGVKYNIIDDYLFALGLEKSGFKGMRLIINRELLPNIGRDYNVRWDGFRQNMFIVNRLQESELYPSGDNYADILWMIENETTYEKLLRRMQHRFRHSITDTDEFEQAAWTRVVFDQVSSLIHMCRNPR